jgi:hypothetical protein
LASGIRRAFQRFSGFMDGHRGWGAGVTPESGGYAHLVWTILAVVVVAALADLVPGLTAAGVAEADATAAVFVGRRFTFYLPPSWGWFTLMWMRKREIL